MLLLASFLVLFVNAKGYPYPQLPKNPNGPPVAAKNPNYDFFIPERSPYTYQLLEPPQLGYQPQPQQQLGYQPQHQPQQQPGYQQINPQQPYPGVQPQIILYHGSPYGGGDTPYNPFSPPGTNFLYPQPGPNVIRNNPPRPIFAAGYPKPAHIPPIEKDAEEVPTNPAKIPPFGSKAKKPERLETFNEDELPKTPQRNNQQPPLDLFNLQADQRFFNLNGQPLYNFFPQNNQLYPYNPYYLYNEPLPSLDQKHFPPKPLNNFPLYKPYEAPKQPTPADPIIVEEPKDDKAQPRDNYEQDSVVIEGIDVEKEEDDTNSDSEVVAAVDSSKLEQPTIAQAQPGAIALAGPGGVAAAAPRGTSFVGRGGVAVSSPQATAVAGPARDQVSHEEEETVNEEDEEKKKKKQ